MPSIAKAVERMHYYCAVASVGYDQSNRYDVRDGGETDCSWLVIQCLKEGGFDTGGATYTGNMSAELCARGWKRLPVDLATCRTGDILLNDLDHVAMVVAGSGWSATLAQASIDENGNISGGRSGDQTGFETNERKVYDYPWNCILRYGGASDAAMPKLPKYRVFRAGKWGRWQSNGKVAGRTGKPIWDVQIKNLGARGWYELTLQGGTVLPRNQRNTARALPVIGVNIYYDTPDPGKTGYYSAKYRVHTIAGEWLRWEYDDNGGGAGDDRNAIDKLRLTLSPC